MIWYFICIYSKPKFVRGGLLGRGGDGWGVVVRGWGCGGTNLAIEKGCVSDSQVRLYSWLESWLGGSLVAS